VSRRERQIAEDYAHAHAAEAEEHGTAA